MPWAGKTGDQGGRNEVAAQPTAPESPRQSLIKILRKIYAVIAREEKEPSRKQAFAKFLNVSPKELGFAYYNFPVYKMVPVAVACNDWAEKQLEHYLTNYDFDGTETFPYTTQVEIGPGISKLLPVGWFCQITTANKAKIMLGVHHEGSWNYQIEVYTANDQELANQVVRDLVETITKRNIYKNQRILLMGQEVCFVNDPPLAFDGIVLPEHILKTLKENTIGLIEASDKFRQLGFKIKRGVLLEGAPGTGKTACFKALSSCGIGRFTSLFVSSRRYEEDFITYLFQVARDLAPCIVFLEDLDMWASSRDGFPGQILGNLLKELDGIEENDGVLVCASTNNLEVIDKALKNRPSRFDIILHVGPLATDERRNLLEKLFHTCLKLTSDQIDFRTLAEALGPRTGAEIQEYVFRVAQKFLNKIPTLTTNECLEVLESGYKPDLDSSKVGFQR